MIYPGEYFHVHLKRMCILLLLDGMLYKYQLSLSVLMCHLRHVSLLIFCLDDLFIDESGVLMSPTIVCLFIHLFIFWLHRVLVVAHGIFVEACRVFCCGVQASL